MKKLLLIGLASTLLFSLSCKKDEVKNTPTPEPTPTPVDAGTVKLEMNHMVDNAALVFNTNYINANGDTFKVNKFNYFISNIVFTRTDNSTYAETESYHIVRHSSSGLNVINLASVPVGTYKSVRFMLGVDSARNISGAQTGDLDPARVSDMFWTWSTGYIHLKLEGTSPQSKNTGNALTFHFGGYGGVNKTQRIFELAFANTPITVTKSSTSSVVVNMNVNELFRTPNLIKFASSSFIMSAGASAKTFADNYADMMTLKEIRN